MKYLFDRNPSIAACLAVFLLMTVRVIYFYYSPDEILIGVIPDDAFYYMQLAKHRETEGFWTFDGTSPATGFHFLYGYLLFFIYSIFGQIDWRQLFLIIGGSATVLISLAAYFVSLTAESLYGRKSILFAITPFFSTIALTQCTDMMESWLLIFFSALTIYYLSKEQTPSTSDELFLIVLGFLGSLSRTDYGMLPGVIFFMYLVSAPIVKNNGIKRSSLVLAGAIMGIAVVLLQNLFISGQPLQASAQTKFYWSSIAGHSISPSIHMVRSIAFPIFDHSNKYFTFLISFILLFTAFSYRYSLNKSEQKEYRKQFSPSPILISGCAVTIFAYIYFYRFASQGLQPWYSANFIAPIGIIFAAIGYYLFGSKMFVPALFCFLLYVFLCISNIFYVPWPHQAGMRQAGLYLKDHKMQAIFGSWNAGIISYFSGVRLINIDGLTNDEVLPFIKRNSLFDYIKKRKYQLFN